MPVAADDVPHAQDAVRIGRAALAQVLNIKLAKERRGAGAGYRRHRPRLRPRLMIRGDGGDSARHGVQRPPRGRAGGFDWVVSDSPSPLTDYPITGGYRREGARYRLDGGTPGHGAASRCSGVAVRVGASLLLACLVLVAMSAPMARRISG